MSMMDVPFVTTKPPTSTMKISCASTYSSRSKRSTVLDVSDEAIRAAIGGHNEMLRHHKRELASCASCPIPDNEL